MIFESVLWKDPIVKTIQEWPATVRNVRTKLLSSNWYIFIPELSLQE